MTSTWIGLVHNEHAYPKKNLKRIDVLFECPNKIFIERLYIGMVLTSFDIKFYSRTLYLLYVNIW